jgi:hypothetical protein
MSDLGAVAIPISSNVSVTGIAAVEYPKATE